MPMTYVARALEIDETRGFMKAVVDADTRQILGAAVLGIEGGEIMSQIQLAMMAISPTRRCKTQSFPIQLFPNRSTTSSIILSDARALRLEHVPQLEKPLLMAGVAHTSAEEQWPQRRLRDNSCRDIGWKRTLIRKAIHLSEFKRSSRVYLFSHKRRQRKQNRADSPSGMCSN